MEAARRAQAPLIRFNMSSSTTIANICGAAVPSEVNGKVMLHFTKDHLRQPLEKVLGYCWMNSNHCISFFVFYLKIRDKNNKR